MKRNILHCIILIAAAFIGNGCATYKDQAKGANAVWTTGQVADAAKQFSQKADNAKGSKDAIIWNLEAGAACRAVGDFDDSNEYLEAAALKIDDYEKKAKVRIGNEAAAAMSNQQSLPYVGRSYDKIMLHTYRALNYMAMDEAEDARPELVRAYQRQQDAVEENKKRIESAEKMAQDAKNQEKIDRAKSDARFSATLENVTKDLDGFKFYADYVNPFTVYLDGIYFLHAGSGGADLERATTSLKRVAEFAADNKFIQADLATAKDTLDGKQAPPCTYVIFETGQAATRDQIRIDIPIIVGNVPYVGAAFPKLVFHNDHAPYLRVKAGAAEENTAVVASMDAIVALDFKNELPTIITKTVISTVTKAAASYAANRAASQQSTMAGLIVKVATTAYQAAVNIADTRSWTTLPKEVQVARVPTPKDRKLTIATANSMPTDITLEEGTINVVCVRSISAIAPLQVSQFILK